MGVKLASSGGGSVELTPPSTASNYTAAFPALTGTVVVADSTGVPTFSNGLTMYNQAISASVTVPTGYSSLSVGPVTISSGQSVTLASGSRWVVV